MPVLALLVISLIALIFIFIGQVNTLGPIVTMPFMLTYAAVDYSHFVLVLRYNKSQGRGSLDAACSDDVQQYDSKPSQILVSPINYEYGAVMETKEKEQRKRISPEHGGWTHHKTSRDDIVHDMGDVSETTSLASETDATKSLLRNGKKYYLCITLLLIASSVTQHTHNCNVPSNFLLHMHACTVTCFRGLSLWLSIKKIC